MRLPPRGAGVPPALPLATAEQVAARFPATGRCRVCGVQVVEADFERHRHDGNSPPANP